MPPETPRTQLKSHAPEHAPKAPARHKSTTPTQSPATPQNRAHQKPQVHRKAATPTQSPSAPQRRAKNPRRWLHLGFECSIAGKKRGSVRQSRQQPLPVPKAGKSKPESTVTKARPKPTAAKTHLQPSRLHQSHAGVGTGGNGIHFLNVHPTHTLGIIDVAHGA